MTMDAQAESFYRSVFADLTVDQEESKALADYFARLNPPPDKLVWLRAAAFRIGSEFLSNDDHDKNVALLRAINVIVHTLEKTCMEPAPLENTSSFTRDRVDEFYKGLFDDLSVDREEAAELVTFFKTDNPPPTSELVTVRATAFKTACDYLNQDGDRDANVQLLRCINIVVHAFEQTCLRPKPFTLQLKETVDLSMSLNDAVQHLWDLDVNRLTPDVDYKLNVQRGKKPYWKEDAAPDPLFTFVDKAVWKRPTYATFVALLDNYIAETGTSEHISDSERREIWRFLHAIGQTGPMQFCHKYCHKHAPSKVPSSHDAFLKLLHKIWFELYRRSRGGRLDSSGFEHVFVGEVHSENKDVSGFHNWIQFYLEEKTGALDYRGYIKPKSRSDALADSNDHVLTLQFAWKGVEKYVGTSFIGVSPEFEMALYTMCFLVGNEENEVELHTGTDVFGMNIKCYKMADDKVGTTFPVATSHHEE